MASALPNSSSLFFDWTDPPATVKHIPALYLSEQLVRLIGSDVCTYRRNAQASYRFVDTAHRFICEIRGLVEKVLNDNCLDSFKVWTQALKPLEKALLEFEPNDFRGSGQLVDTSTLAGCRIDLDNWKSAREKTKKNIKLLTDVNELKKLASSSDGAADLQHDDQAFVDDLVAEIKEQASKASLLKLPEKYVESLKAIEKLAIALSSLLRKGKDSGFSEDSEVLLVQSMMAVYGWGHFAAGQAPDLDPKANLKHLRSKEVCSKAEELMNGLKDLGDNKAAKKTLTQVQEDYQAFINLVFGKPEFSCLDMMKLLSKIGRAYYAQALALIMLCDDAIKQYDSQHRKDPDESHSIKLNQALEATLDTLKTAVGIFQASADAAGLPKWQPYKLDKDYSEHACTKKFKESLTLVIDCMGQLGLSDASGQEASFQSALTDDMEHMKKANERLIGDPSSKETIEVTLKLYEGSNTESAALMKPYIVNVSKTTLISAIEWGIRRIPEVMAQCKDKAVEFEREPTEPKSPPITKSQKIADIAGTNKKLTLLAVVTDYIITE
ncbi:hypothetical protein RhiJN_22508 [Ceratobasidium sp. AG-Ba]|nr:hypothetical protein RhiJN_22508 [Ceratobasidium sp. AG-Ba]